VEVRGPGDFSAATSVAEIVASVEEQLGGRAARLLERMIAELDGDEAVDAEVIEMPGDT